MGYFFWKNVGKNLRNRSRKLRVTGTHNRTVWMLKLLNQKSIVSK